MEPLLEGLLRSLGGSEANFLEVSFGRIPSGNVHTKATSKKSRPPYGNFRPTPPQTPEKSLQELFQSRSWLEEYLNIGKIALELGYLWARCADVHDRRGVENTSVRKRRADTSFPTFAFLAIVRAHYSWVSSGHTRAAKTNSHCQLRPPPPPTPEFTRSSPLSVFFLR